MVESLTQLCTPLSIKPHAIRAISTLFASNWGAFLLSRRHTVPFLQTSRKALQNRYPSTEAL